MNIKRKSKGTPEQMLQAFENKINELEDAGSIESATSIESSESWAQVDLNAEDEYKYSGNGGRSWVPINSDKVDTWPSREAAIENGKSTFKPNYKYGIDWDVENIGAVESATHLDESDDYIDGTSDIFKTGDRVKEKYTDTFDVGTVIEVDTENNRYLVEYDYTDFENPRWEDGSSIEEWTPELEEYYNSGITSSTDSVRQQDYDTLVAQGMTPEEAWAEIENYDYSDDYDDIDAATDIKATDEVNDSEYLEKLCEYVTINLDDAGYEATAYIKDGYLVIESMYDTDSQFIQDIEEIEPNWDDLDSDAQELSDAYIEKYPDPTYSQSEDDEY